MIVCGYRANNALTAHEPWFLASRLLRVRVSAEDIDNEDKGVGALDADLGGARLAVAVGRRDDEHYAAANCLADEASIPALDDLAGAVVERERLRARPRGVEDLARPPDHAGVLDDHIVATGDLRAGALDEG